MVEYLATINEYSKTNAVLLLERDSFRDECKELNTTKNRVREQLDVLTAASRDKIRRLDDKIREMNDQFTAMNDQLQKM